MYEKTTKVVDEFQTKVMDYKTQLMGWSIILIVLCHSSAIGISSVFFAGMIGADIFILLSGYSLGFSINRYPVKTFYSRRMYRIYPMYLILALSTCIIIHVISKPLTIYDFFSTALFLPFYGLNEGGVFVEWYLSISVLLYLLYPVLFKLPPKHLLIGSCLLAFSIHLLFSSDIIHINSLLACGLARLPMFSWGIFLFKTKGKNTSVQWYALWIVLLVLSLCVYIYGIRIHFFWLIDCVTPFVVILLFKVVQKYNLFAKTVYIIGRYSIEIYVANLTMVTLCNLLHSNVIVKTLVYFCGTFFFSTMWVYLNRIIQKLIQRFSYS